VAELGARPRVKNLLETAVGPRPQNVQAGVIAFAERLRLSRQVRELEGLMDAVRLDAENPPDDPGPDLGFDPDEDDDGTPDAYLGEPVDEPLGSAAPAPDDEPSFAIVLADGRVHIENLLDPQLELAYDADLWRFVGKVIDELESLLNARYGRLTRRLRAHSRERLGLISVTELAARLSFGGEQVETARIWVSSFINHNTMLLPDGRVEPVSYFFWQVRGSDWELNEAILESARQVFYRTDSPTTLTDLAKMIVQESGHTPLLEKWLQTLRGKRIENTVAKRLQRVVPTYLAEAADGSEWSDAFEEFLDQIVANGAKRV
jgi:hypothetical protein